MTCSVYTYQDDHDHFRHHSGIKWLMPITKMVIHDVPLFNCPESRHFISDPTYFDINVFKPTVMCIGHINPSFRDIGNVMNQYTSIRHGDVSCQSFVTI